MESLPPAGQTLPPRPATTTAAQPSRSSSPAPPSSRRHRGTAQASPRPAYSPHRLPSPLFLFVSPSVAHAGFRRCPSGCYLECRRRQPLTPAVCSRALTEFLRPGEEACMRALTEFHRAGEEACMRAAQAIAAFHRPAFQEELRSRREIAS